MPTDISDLVHEIRDARQGIQAVSDYIDELKRETTDMRETLEWYGNRGPFHLGERARACLDRWPKETT